jgi:hypothetical protein
MFFTSNPEESYFISKILSSGRSLLEQNNLSSVLNFKFYLFFFSSVRPTCHPLSLSPLYAWPTCQLPPFHCCTPLAALNNVIGHLHTLSAAAPWAPTQCLPLILQHQLTEHANFSFSHTESSSILTAISTAARALVIAHLAALPTRPSNKRVCANPLLLLVPAFLAVRPWAHRIYTFPRRQWTVPSRDLVVDSPPSVVCSPSTSSLWISIVPRNSLTLSSLLPATRRDLHHGIRIWDMDTPIQICRYGDTTTSKNKDMPIWQVYI